MATVRIKKGRAKPLWSRHPWVFSGAIHKTRGSFQPGDLVEVEDVSGRFIGRGYINPKSNITVRLLTWDPEEQVGYRFFRQKLLKAVEMRSALGVPKVATGYRLVHGEGDGLPGLVVDRYGDYLVLQIGTLGMDRYREDILDALEDILQPKGVIGRTDQHFAELEGFEGKDGLLRGNLPEGPVVIEENGIRFAVDLVGGQKTGFYFDQRENRLRVAEFCRDKRVLDCFSYTGAFSLYCKIKGGARQVFGIESSAPAIALAERNLELNGNPDLVILQGEVFWELQNLVNRGELFDLVITDPPKFVNAWDNLEKGLQAYKFLNTLAILVLDEGGLLAACSCSGIVEDEVFERLLMDCAIEAKRELRIVERRNQAVDHPVSPSCPESRYLKCYLCAVV
ncbi:MAG: class I SAM-dependent rRNA methyltransferase [Planctomycetes bacterium]|nr:class I SAM-dependent rRNA methyltransferase [Planctomycetota bacterium]